MNQADSASVLMPRRDVQLHRWPRFANDPLQAWDAADELLLQHVSTLDLPQSPKVIVLNDAQGALATCLHSLSPLSWSDSMLSHRAAVGNLSENGIDKPLRVLASTADPQGMFDLVLIRIPKTTALLQDQLMRLRPCMHANTVIVAAGMVKHLQKSAFTCLEQMMGAVSPSLAVRKARLLFVQFDQTLEVAASPYPTRFTDIETGLSLVNHANVFSRDHLDHGARFLLAQYPQLPVVSQAIDLGCGNGVLGIALQQRMADAMIEFIDESYSAVESARLNYLARFPDQQSRPASAAGFVVANALEQRASESAELILCNPPFHQQHTLGERVARSMFIDSKRCLRQSGELWVVANRHLDYGSRLRQLFGHCRTVASNRKFTVLRAVKRD